MNIPENLHTHKTNNKWIIEQKQTYTKHDTIYKQFNIEKAFYARQKNKHSNDTNGRGSIR